MMYCSVCLKHRGHKIWYIKLLSTGETLIYPTGLSGESRIVHDRQLIKENGTGPHNIQPKKTGLRLGPSAPCRQH